MPPKSTSNVQTFNDLQERAQDGDEEVAGASAPRGTKRRGEEVTDSSRQQPPRRTRTSPRNRNDESSSQSQSTTQNTDGQTLGRGEGAVVPATNNTRTDEEMDEAYDEEDFLRDQLLLEMLDSDGNVPSAVEHNQELKKLHEEIDAKLRTEQGDYYALIGVDRPAKNELSDAAFGSRVLGALQQWSSKLDKEKLGEYPDMPEGMKAAAAHLNYLIHVGAATLRESGPLPVEEFIANLGGLPPSTWNPPQPPPNGAVPSGVRSAYGKATEAFKRAWAETRDGLTGNISEILDPIVFASGAAFALSSGSQVTYNIRYDDLLGLIRDRTLPGLEKQNIFIFDWILKKYGYPAAWLPDEKRRIIRDWQPSADDRLDDANLSERFSIGVTGLRAGGETTGVKNLTAGIRDKPMSYEAEETMPDEKKGHTAIGIIVGIKKRGNSFLVMLNLGTEAMALIVAVPGSALGRNVAQSWYSNNDLPKGSVGPHSEWAQKKASDKDFGYITAVVWGSALDPDDPWPRVPTSYWLVEWKAGTKDEEGNLRHPEWLPGSLLRRIIDLERMIKAYKAFYKRQKDHLAKIQKSIDDGVHPDTNEELTKQQKDSMPWLAEKLDILDIQDQGQNPKLWRLMNLNTKAKRIEEAAKAKTQNAGENVIGTGGATAA